MSTRTKILWAIFCFIIGVCLPFVLFGCKRDSEVYPDKLVKGPSSRNFQKWCYKGKEYLIYESVNRFGIAYTGEPCDE